MSTHAPEYVRSYFVTIPIMSPAQDQGEYVVLLGVAGLLSQLAKDWPNCPNDALALAISEDDAYSLLLGIEGILDQIQLFRENPPEVCN